MLSVIDLTRNFGGLCAVNQVSFTVHEAEVVGLIGPNGSGKSTTLNLVTGMYRPTAGRIVYQGRDIQGKQPWEIAYLGIRRTFQSTEVFAGHSVLENMLFACHLSGRVGVAAALVRFKEERTEKKLLEDSALEILEFVGLANVASLPANALAAGLQRLLAVAMCLAGKPALLLLDEPAVGLNKEEGRHVVELIQKVQRKGIGVLLVDHDMHVIMAACNRIVVLDHGTKIAEGTPEQVRSNEAVLAAYLGDDYGEGATSLPGRV